MSVRDKDGNRISVPNQVIQQAAGYIAEKVVANLRIDRLVQQALDGSVSSADLRRESEREFQEARVAHTEPPDDGMEYETVARTATVRSTKNKVKETKDTSPIYVWGLQSSKPRNGGHFITYEVQLKEDGTTSCNCPGWIFKKSSEDRGCKHTRVVEVEAKDFFKKHKKGESLPTVAPSEEQMLRLQKSKAGVATDTMIKFNRVVDLD